MEWYKLTPKYMQPWRMSKQPMGMKTVTDGKAAGIACFSNKMGDSWEDLKRKLGAHQARNVVVVDEPQGQGTRSSTSA